ncbi:hypothetical protein CHELA1G11_11874 [Hyphomicrobiales bacterium]|nr:hypothetical protein CHELA1G11_11874 [Hyphomicrobiales bacterium]
MQPIDMLFRLMPVFARPSIGLTK